MSCKGLRFDKKTKANILCSKKKLNENGYCDAHKHQNDYTKKQKETMKPCFCCHILFYSDARAECQKCYDRRHNKTRCKGQIAPRGKSNDHVGPCPREPVDGKICCKLHEYMENYTDDMFKNLTRCIRCSKMYYMNGNKCDACTKGINGDKNRCTGKRVKRENKEICDCIDIVENKGDFCTNHIYQKDYTKEMMDNLAVCCGCKKAYYLVNTKMCESCNVRIVNLNKAVQTSSKIKKEVKEKEKQIKLTQKKEKCKAFNTIETADKIEVLENVCTYNAKQGSNYCKKHEYLKQFDDIDKTTLRKCNRCSKIFIYSDYKSCNSCKVIIQEKQAKDKEDRHNKGFCKIINYKTNIQCKNVIVKNNMCTGHYEKYGDKDIDEINKSNQIPEAKEEQKICGNARCKMPYDAYLTDTGKDANHCKKCYEEDKIREETRNERDRLEYYKEYESKEETKKIRKQWRDDHYNRVSSYTMNFRKKLREENEVLYLHNRNEYAKNWRKNNPDKVKKINDLNKINPKTVLSNYKNEALYKGILWELTDDEAYDFFYQKCYYCDEDDIGKLMGIDRIKYNLCYNKNNCVPCCKTCNNMKICLDFNVFINRCYHISIYNKFIEGKLQPEIFKDYDLHTNYNKYKSRADKKNLSFEICEEYFGELTQMNCYICGKKPTMKHKNGIDRLDNTKGYIINNCKSCCSNCNYMKKNLDYTVFLEKCKSISYNFEETIDKLLVDIENDNLDIIINVNVNKMTKNEKDIRQKEIITERVNNTKNNNTESKIKERCDKLHQERINNKNSK